LVHSLAAAVVLPENSKRGFQFILALAQRVLFFGALRFIIRDFFRLERILVLLAHYIFQSTTPAPTSLPEVSSKSDGEDSFVLDPPRRLLLVLRSKT
jgi:hypothetical protein